MKTCQNIHELARELNIERKLLSPGSISSRDGRSRGMRLGIAREERKEEKHREEIARLKVALADKPWKTVFFEVPCRRSRWIAL